MKHTGMLPFRTALCGLIWLAAFARADDLSTEYCSTQNTGTDGPFYSIYNSMGSCSTQCQDQYAFGIVQGKNCWCSNYIPSEQGSVSSCDVACPGFPSDMCGNPDQGMYGYIPLGNPPQGTAGASSSQSTSAPPSTKTTPSETPSSNPPSSTSFSSYSSSSSSSSSSSTSKDTTTTKSVVMTQVTTISGSAVTQTVTSTPVGMAPNDAGSDPPKLERTGLSAGAIAGVVLGVLLGVALLALGAFLLWRRRRNGDAEGGSSGTPKRKGSVLSRAGLLGAAARPQSMSENNYDEPYSADGVTRSNSIRNSMMFGSGIAGEGVAAAGPLGSSSDTSSERRHSRPMVYDQRLNPSALFAHHDNGSRVSMQDQQDYSRPLGLANPDFPRSYSYDSR